MPMSTTGACNDACMEFDNPVTFLEQLKNTAPNAVIFTVTEPTITESVAAVVTQQEAESNITLSNYKINNILLRAIHTRENVQSCLQLSRDIILHVENATLQQRRSEIWKELRSGRITASNFGRALAAAKQDKCSASLLKQIQGMVPPLRLNMEWQFINIHAILRHSFQFNKYCNDVAGISLRNKNKCLGL